jgi:hypothetical protein
MGRRVWSFCELDGCHQSKIQGVLKETLKKDLIKLDFLVEETEEY